MLHNSLVVVWEICRLLCYHSADIWWNPCFHAKGLPRFQVYAARSLIYICILSAVLNSWTKEKVLAGVKHCLNVLQMVSQGNSKSVLIACCSISRKTSSTSHSRGFTIGLGTKRDADQRRSERVSGRAVSKDEETFGESGSVTVLQCFWIKFACARR